MSCAERFDVPPPPPAGRPAPDVCPAAPRCERARTAALTLVLAGVCVASAWLETSSWLAALSAGLAVIASTAAIGRHVVGAGAAPLDGDEGGSTSSARSSSSVPARPQRRSVSGC